jgi:hypothetical protein
MNIRLVQLFLCISLLTGCAKNYRDEFLRQAKDKGWTEEQRLAALAHSDRLYFLTKDSSGTYKPNYARLSKTHVREKLEKGKEDLNQLLGYDDDENARYVEYFGLRQSLEHEEEVLKAVYDRVRAAELHDQFKQLIGAAPPPSPYDSHHFSGYNARQIFASTDLAKAFSFSIDQLDYAKQQGMLKVIEQAHTSLQRKFDRKEKNPSSPDDPNDFVWKSKKYDIEVTSYKVLDVEKPEDNDANYLEGYRLHDGKKESLPALRIVYMDELGQGALLLDVDKEGETGFGLPDLVEPVERPVTVADVLADTDLLDLLFTEKKSQKRVRPKAKSVFVEIARVNKKPVDVWEQAPDEKGWAVPFRYKNDLQSNYNAKLVFAKLEKSTDPAAGFYKQIKYLKKEWISGNNRYLPSLGNVVEYYRMKPPYHERNLVHAQVLQQEDTKKVSLVLKDEGTEQTLIVLPGTNRLIEDLPIMIEYTEGQKRWRIQRDEQSKTFTRRKEVSTSKKNSTGIYSEQEME